MLYRFFIVLFFLLFFNQVSNSQGFYTDFGQNRVQYHTTEWSYYDSQHFVTYFYQGGFDLGKFVSTYAERNLNEIESILEYRISHKIQIMVYHNISDAKQTNIGIYLPDINTGGITKVINNKMFVYFDGNHQHLARQIKAGIAKILIQNMLSGENIQEYLQNAVLLNLPNWFLNGLESYIAEEWNTEYDIKLKQFIEQNKFLNFNKLSTDEATFAGHALWHYISQTNGNAAIPNILYITRINRSMESGFMFVLGSSFSALVNDMIEYNKNLKNLEPDRNQFNELDKLPITIKTNKNRPIIVDKTKISPNGKYIAYTTNEQERHKVYVYNTETKTSTLVLKTGFRNPFTALDPNYPLLAFSNNSKNLAVIYGKKDDIHLLIYDTENNTKKEENFINKFQQVVDVCYGKSEQYLIFSADKGGQIDLFYYHIPNTKVTQITNDFYTDLQPHYVEIGNKKGIVFASNRPNDTLYTQRLDSILPINNLDIFFYNTQTQDSVLVQFTNTPLANETLPVQLDSSYISFLSNNNGINNLYAAYFDSIYIRTDTKVFFKDSMIVNPNYRLDSFIKAGLIDTVINQLVYKTIGKNFAISNYNNNILESDVAVASQKTLLLTKNKTNLYELYLKNNPINPKIEEQQLKNTTYRNQIENWSKNKKTEKPKETDYSFNDALLNTPATPPAIPIDTTSKNTSPQPKTNDKDIDTENYYFQNEFDFIDNKTTNNPSQNLNTTPKPTNNPTITDDNKNIGGDDFKFIRTKIRIYRPIFTIDNVTSQIDNTSLYTQYQSFNAGPVGYSAPDLSGLIKIGITDLFENYKINAGFRIPIALGGSEYFVDYKALKKRLDKEVVLYRKSNTKDYTLIFEEGFIEPKNVKGKTTTTYSQIKLSYPFNTYSSIRGSFGIRVDKLTFLATDTFSLKYLNNVSENWAYTKFEYVYDNTFPITTNILNGTRLKAYLEFQKPFEANISREKVNFNLKNTGFLGIIGLDARHYQRLHKQITLCTRFAMAHSFGSRKMLYYLGGVENWLTIQPGSQFDYETFIDTKQNYGFQSLATNLRGFKQNARNGNSFAVLNTEVRIPVFTYLSTKPIASDLLRNFQFVGFFDVGSAWTGLLPFEQQNRYYTIDVGNEPVTASVKYFKDPLAIGYGLGIRTSLLGYFLKADAAWGIDSGKKTDRKIYLSMGLDF